MVAWLKTYPTPPTHFIKDLIQILQKIKRVGTRNNERLKDLMRILQISIKKIESGALDYLENPLQDRVEGDMISPGQSYSESQSRETYIALKASIDEHERKLAATNVESEIKEQIESIFSEVVAWLRTPPTPPKDYINDLMQILQKIKGVTIRNIESDVLDYLEEPLRIRVEGEMISPRQCYKALMNFVRANYIMRSDKKRGRTMMELEAKYRALYVGTPDEYWTQVKDMINNISYEKKRDVTLSDIQRVIRIIQDMKKVDDQFQDSDEKLQEIISNAFEGTREFFQKAQDTPFDVPVPAPAPAIYSISTNNQLPRGVVPISLANDVSFKPLVPKFKTHVNGSESKLPS